MVWTKIKNTQKVKKNTIIFILFSTTVQNGANYWNSFLFLGYKHAVKVQKQLLTNEKVKNSHLCFFTLCFVCKQETDKADELADTGIVELVLWSLEIWGGGGSTAL